jgi:hypothetical protein
MIIAEGVMMYLPEDTARPLLGRLTKHFSTLDLSGRGAQGRIFGFYAANGLQHFDHQLADIEHLNSELDGFLDALDQSGNRKWQIFCPISGINTHLIQGLLYSMSNSTPTVNCLFQEKPVYLPSFAPERVLKFTLINYGQ